MTELDKLRTFSSDEVLSAVFDGIAKMLKSKRREISFHAEYADDSDWNGSSKKAKMRYEGVLLYQKSGAKHSWLFAKGDFAGADYLSGGVHSDLVVFKAEEPLFNVSNEDIKQKVLGRRVLSGSRADLFAHSVLVALSRDRLAQHALSPIDLRRWMESRGGVRRFAQNPPMPDCGEGSTSLTSVVSDRTPLNHKLVDCLISGVVHHVQLSQ